MSQSQSSTAASLLSVNGPPVPPAFPIAQHSQRHSERDRFDSNDLILTDDCNWVIYTEDSGVHFWRWWTGTAHYKAISADKSSKLGLPTWKLESKKSLVWDQYEQVASREQGI